MDLLSSSVQCNEVAVTKETGVRKCLSDVCLLQFLSTFYLNYLYTIFVSGHRSVGTNSHRLIDASLEFRK